MDMYFKIVTTENDQHHWELRNSGNLEILGTSESMHNLNDCIAICQKIADGKIDTSVIRFEDRRAPKEKKNDE